MTPFYSLTDKQLTLWIHVIPGSSQNCFAGFYGDKLKIKLTARANDNQANTALCVFLAEYFDLPKTSVDIKSGHSSRQKTIVLTIKSKDQIMRKLEQLAK